jgi:type 1 glutamine amidotransferase/HEAT repeat protein
MKPRISAQILGLLAATLFQAAVVSAAEPLKALIIDGQNNHDWKTTTPILKQALESSARFTVAVATSPPAGQDQSDFNPKFADFDVVVSNYNGDLWSDQTQKDFVEFVKSGGGFVAVHAANNPFPEWKEYNQIIGLGGWNNRSEKDGPYIRYRDGQIVRDTSPGPGGSHGTQHAYEIIHRVTDHPIVQGLPEKWTHVKDELYDRLRGPAENLTVLATAFSSKDTNGTGEHEPVMMTIQYGQGRVFHTTLGHSPEAMTSAEFRAILCRGAEWAATGKVTLPIPKDFPGTDPFERIKTYTFDDDGAFLEDIAIAVRAAINDPAKRSAMEAKLIALLAPETPLACKTFVCRQLRLIGTDQSVDVLASMLRDEKLSDLARYALEGHPSKSVDKVLERALATTVGQTKIGIINTIGQRRDENSVKTLSPLFTEEDQAVVVATIHALGKIGGAQAYLQLISVKDGPADLLADAMLLCGDSLAEQGDAGQASQIYQKIFEDLGQLPRHRMAAIRGQLALKGEEALPMVLNLLSNDDAGIRSVAIEFVLGLPGRDVTEKLASQLKNLSADAQPDLIEALADRNDAAAVPALLAAAKHDDDAVRRAAIQGLGRIDNAADAVEPLLAVAARPPGEAGDVARRALAQMSGSGINPILVQKMRNADPAERLEALRALTARGAKAHVTDIFIAAEDVDPAVRFLAIESIGRLGAEQHYPLLVSIVALAESQEERDGGQDAILKLSDRVEAGPARVQPIISALTGSPVPGQVVCLSLLSKLGGDAALEAVRQAIQDKNPKVREAAVNALAQWPDAGPIDDLRGLLASAEHRSLRPLAIRGYIRLIGMPSDRTVSSTLELYETTMMLADELEVKRLVMAGVSELVEADALRYVESYAEDAEIGPDANKAARKIKKALEGPPIATASHGQGNVKNALDGDPGSRWDTGTPMKPGMWFMLDLKSQKLIKSVELDSKNSSGDYPRAYELYVSNNSNDMGRPVSQGEGDGPVTTITLAEPVRGRYVKVVQTGNTDGLFWSIHELKIDHE